MARKTTHFSPSLERFRRRLDQWRRARKGRARLPEDLWAAAAELARECGVYKTARALRLDYYSLKKRVDTARVNGAVAEVTPTFLEFLPSDATSTGRLSECTVEFDDGCGGKMRISLKGADTADLVALSRAFWGARQ